jgi:hypothetical protein
MTYLTVPNPQLMLVVFNLLTVDAPLERDTGSRSKEEVSMSAQAQEPKGPEVHVKKAPAKAKSKVNEVAAKQMRELAAEIQRLDGLRNDLKALMVKAHKANAPTAAIAEAANYSVARTRQILSQ